MEILLFNIEGEDYGVPLNEVDEVLNMTTLKPVPGAPSFLMGAFNLRGELIPVTDLNFHLGLGRQSPPPPLTADESPSSPYFSNTRMLLMKTERGRFAVIMDGWDRLKNFDESLLNDGVVRDEGKPDFVDGLVMEDGSMIQLLRLQQLLRADEMDLLTSQTNLE